MKAKKSNKFFALIIPIFIFIAGCQSQQAENPYFNDDIPMDRRIGQVKSLGGVKTESQGTHILQMDNGDTILLKSTAINLDDQKYSGETVEVRGLLTYTKDARSLMEVMNIDILEQYEAKEAAKAKWQVYSNVDFGFSIKYRDDFLKSENADGVTFKIVADEDEVSGEEDAAEGVAEVETAISDDTADNTYHLVMVKVESKEEDENLAGFLGLEGETSEDLLKEGLTFSKIGAESLDAYKNESMDGAGLTFYAEGEKYFYTVTFEAGTDKDYAEAKNLFYEMLGSFKISDGLSGVEDEADGDTVNDQESEDVEEDDDEEDAALSEGGTEDDESFEEEDDETSEEEDSESDTEISVEDGFNVFENETFEFSIQYPKNWYYSGSASSESDVVRRYEFGDEPTEEQPGNVFLDILNTDLPEGTRIDANGTDIVKVVDGDTVEIYVKGEDRNFRLSGPLGVENTLLQMAQTLE